MILGAMEIWVQEVHECSQHFYFAVRVHRKENGTNGAFQSSTCLFVCTEGVVRIDIRREGEGGSARFGSCI